MSLYSVVVPVYNSEHTLQELYTRLEKVFREVIKEEFELILVDDGSKDRSFEVMQELRAKDNRVRIIQMARNFGQHPALLCGFAHVKGDFVVTMDDDLQHQPEELPKMINVMRERDDVDAIIASYEGRQHGFIRKLGTKFSVWATSKMLGKDPDLQITSYRLIRRFLVDAMVKTNTYLPQIGNLLVLTSNRIINVPVQHAARVYGKSGYSFKRLVKDLIYDITAHTAFPLLMVRNIGIASFLVSMVMAVYFLVRYFAFGVSVEGWTSLMMVMLAFFGLILLSIGIMGIYQLDAELNVLLPRKKLGESECLYLVNYYGQLTDEKILAYQKIFGNIIVDHTHAFFQKPLKGVDTLYSCRKFWGVSDGAYLSTDAVLPMDKPVDHSNKRMGHILGRYEENAGVYYQEMLQNAARYEGMEIRRMSRLTENLLGAIDYETGRRKREENYRILSEALPSEFIFTRVTPEGPFVYPYYHKEGLKLRRWLAEHKIFVPTYWKNILEECTESSLEYQWAADVLPLPCDQRYGKEEMQYMAERIKEWEAAGE